MLSPQDIDHFIAEGFVRIDQAFPRRIAEEARAILWRDTGCDPDDPASWTKPVVRLGDYAQEPFRLAANTPLLHQTFEESAARPITLATGKAGTVYLCHPFLVHAAQPHHGTKPRFMAQPPLFPKSDLSLEREAGDYSPVEIAIRGALDKGSTL